MSRSRDFETESAELRCYLKKLTVKIIVAAIVQTMALMWWGGGITATVSFLQTAVANVQRDCCP